MGSKKQTDMSATTDTIKIAESQVEPTQEDAQTAETGASDQAGTSDQTGQPAKQTSHRPHKEHPRGKRYVEARSQVDRTREYDPFAAVELIKRLSYSKFPGTITAHGVVRDVGEQATLTFPYSTGKTLRVAIASDEIIAEIEAGKLEFDVLLTTPAFRPKLAKHARVLGPRGLMPNPKQGTLTEKPENKKKELEAGKTSISTERKAPLIHVTIGKTDQETKELVENLTALIKAVGMKLQKLTLAASMSPGVKVKVG